MKLPSRDQAKAPARSGLTPARTSNSGAPPFPIATPTATLPRPSRTFPGPVLPPSPHIAPSFASPRLPTPVASPTLFARVSTTRPHQRRRRRSSHERRDERPSTHPHPIQRLRRDAPATRPASFLSQQARHRARPSTFHPTNSTHPLHYHVVIIFSATWNFRSNVVRLAGNSRGRTGTAVVAARLGDRRRGNRRAEPSGLVTPIAWKPGASKRRPVPGRTGRLQAAHGRGGSSSANRGHGLEDETPY